jgi:hypothetical protein
MGVKTLARRGPEILLAGGTVLALLLLLTGLELGLRLADPRFLDRTRVPTVYSERYGWSFRPGFRGSMHDVWTIINDRGYRGEEHPSEKPPGRTRIVMLGDSILFGTRVREEETFSSLLESRTGRFEVLNLGVEGYGTDQELLLLEHEALGYHPDVVILNFCIDNDATSNARAWDHLGAFPKPYFTLEGGRLHLHDEHLRLTPLRRVAQWLQDDSHLYGRLSAVLPAPTRKRRDPLPRLSRREANELTIRLIQRTDEVARGAGASFMVVFHPNRPGILHHSRLSNRLRRDPRLEGIPMLDLGERYRARGLGPGELLLDYQGHLTPFGHRIAVQEIETWLASAATS